MFQCSFQVYPTLSEKLQSEWDQAEQTRYEGLITEQVNTSFMFHFFPSSLMLIKGKNECSLFSLNYESKRSTDAIFMISAGIQQSVEGYF